MHIFISGYVECIYQTCGNVELLKWGENMLKEMTPPPINSMLTKQPIIEAVAKRKQRVEMTIVDVPPTAGNYTSIWKFYFFEHVLSKW